MTEYLGPNTITGHASVISTEELQVSDSCPHYNYLPTPLKVDYMLGLMKPILYHGVKSIDIKTSEQPLVGSPVRAAVCAYPLFGGDCQHL